jgi:hypothetical protein
LLLVWIVDSECSTVNHSLNKHAMVSSLTLF